MHLQTLYPTRKSLRSMEGIPKWNSMDVHGNIKSVIIVDTYLQCGRCCLQSDVFDGIFYNSTNGYCVIIVIADGFISNVSLGTFFFI